MSGSEVCIGRRTARILPESKMLKKQHSTSKVNYLKVEYHFLVFPNWLDQYKSFEEPGGSASSLGIYA